MDEGFLKDLEKGYGKKELEKLKVELARKYKLNKLPRNTEIFLRSKLNIKTKPTRTESGVAVVAVMTKPIKCKHGRCLMCPGGPGSYFGDTPQSYTGREPASKRGLRNDFDPYLQIFNRLEQYTANGHPIDKVELIIMGGTFPSFNKKYRENFVKYCFKGLNDFSREFFIKDKLNIKKFKDFFELPGDISNEERIKRVKKKILKLKGECNLEAEQIKNEKAKIRCIGLCVETRPDYAGLKEGKEMLKLGATRVEIGMQSVYDSVLRKLERGHNVNDVKEAVKIMKDLGFKVNLHCMLGFLDKKKELEGLRELFRDKELRPDMLKIYPCAVVRGTKLYELWKNGKYKAITNKDAVEIISEFKKEVPEYCRIMRIQRDIPAGVIEAGVSLTNLRQYINVDCRCIRCREKKEFNEKNVKIVVRSYEASDGREFFISAEDVKNDSLIGFCRLRLNDKAIIRELHVYGSLAEIGKKGEKQHRGYGKKLLRKAEELVSENSYKNVLVISGVGAREYYRKLGYRKDGFYMSKKV